MSKPSNPFCDYTEQIEYLQRELERQEEMWRRRLDKDYFSPCECKCCEKWKAAFQATLTSIDMVDAENDRLRAELLKLQTEAYRAKLEADTKRFADNLKSAAVTPAPASEDPAPYSSGL